MIHSAIISLTGWRLNYMESPSSMASTILFWIKPGTGSARESALKLAKDVFIPKNVVFIIAKGYRGAAVFGKHHSITDTHIHRDSISVACTTSRADSDNSRLVDLGLHRFREQHTASGLLDCLNTL